MTDPVNEARILSAEDYDRAAWYRTENLSKNLLNGVIEVHWFGEGDRFWYRKALGDDRFEFRVVDASSGVEAAAFDAAALAAELAGCLGREVDATQLPFELISFEPGGHQIAFSVDGRRWRWDQATGSCSENPMLSQVDATRARSPDGAWVAYSDQDDLWLEVVATGQKIRLTDDGSPRYRYARPSGNHALATEFEWMGVPFPPSIVWSPDSTRFFTQRVDERHVPVSHLYQSCPSDGSPRPRPHAWPRSLPGDPQELLPQAEFFVVDVSRRQIRRVSLGSQPVTLMTMIETGEAWWSHDGLSIFAIAHDRYHQVARLIKIDSFTGTASEIIREECSTFIMLATMGGRAAWTLRSGEILWLSERDGWRHLYLYDASGTLVRQLTGGEWTIRRVVRIDESAGIAYVTAQGREPGQDPYFQNLYAIDLDGNLRHLTPEDAHHSVSNDPFGASATFSPSGNYFIDSYSRVDAPPVHVLRRSDGQVIRQLVEAKRVTHKAGGYIPPERLRFLAADGQTPLYATLYRPTNFDARRRYPILDAVYPGPMIGCAAIGAIPAIADPNAQSLAELGVIVLQLDSRGTPGRSKQFLDYAYGNLQSAGLEDHLAALSQLTSMEPAADISRVGVLGYSGGGYAALRFILEAPGTYKVAAAGSGNHNPAGYTTFFADTFNGPDNGSNFHRLANEELASSLEGKLLLFHGEMDSNVQPAHTLRVVDALIRNNKDFDLLIVPNGGHGNVYKNDYVVRRCWDHFVRHLIGGVPPSQYRIA